LLGETAVTNAVFDLSKPVLGLNWNQFLVSEK